jgi:undecaprenyl-diphosphatase
MGFVVGAVDRIGNVTKRPPIWAVVAAALVWRGGARGHEAAARGGVAYAVAAVLANVVVKPLVKRRRPAGSEQARIGPLTSSFPSGHAATDLAFVFGVSQAVPALFVPLSAVTLTGHWSLVRTRAHHLTDVLAGGALGIAVAAGVGAAWPRGDLADAAPVPSPAPDRSHAPFTTVVDGEEARLLVHVEPIQDGASDDV